MTGTGLEQLVGGDTVTTVIRTVAPEGATVELRLRGEEGPAGISPDAEGEPFEGTVDLTATG